MNSVVVLARSSANPLTVSGRLILLFLMAGFAELLPAQEPLAPGYNELSYELPEPGSYQLPPFGTAADGEVLSEDGKTLSLHQLFDDKYTLLSFIYSNCSDINGCPLSAYVFYQIKSAMQKDARLAKKLQLISLSFDPARDTPPVMRLYGNNFKYAGARGDWHFLTTGSEGELEPILKAYDQDLQRYYSVEDDTRLEYAHILRVFLIDPEKRIRNIYSVGFLHADLVLRDIQTLFLEESAKPGSTLEVTERLAQPGDYKHGYDDTSYQSRSRALTARLGETMDLLNNTINPPLGLPPLPASMTDGLSVEKIELGKKLFFDRRLSHNETFSCAMCHIPEQGFTNNELAKAVGIEGRTVRRNSPTIYNVAYYKKFFHDGREDSLTQQIWGPLLAHNEMGNPSVGAVIGKIKSLPDYEGAFEEIYQGKSVSMETLGDAMAAYQISLLSADSPFDRWYFGKQQDAISDKAKAGFSLFTGKAACASCHLIADDHALFTDQQLHNTGSGYRESMGTGSKTQRVNLAPGVFVDVEREIIDSVSEKPPSDLGLYEITQDPRDRWKYKTPSLRNIAHTAPYMHNGAFGTLEEVVEFYNHGGVANEDLDPRIKPLGLNREEVSSLVEFLQTLDGDNIDALVSDAFTAPVSDRQWIDR